MILQQLLDDDWEDAFDVARREGVEWAPVGSQPGPAPRFGREDVAHIEGMVAGKNDESDWIIYGILNSGHWFYLEAGCDYTGWG